MRQWMLAIATAGSLLTLSMMGPAAVIADDAERSDRPADRQRDTPDRELTREVERLLDELQRLRREVAEARQEAREARREAEELRQFIEDYEEYGRAYDEYRAVRAIREEEVREQRIEAARERYEQERAERQRRIQEVRQQRAEERAERREERRLRDAGFTHLGLDVHIGRTSYYYKTRDVERTRISYDPFLGLVRRVDRRDEIDYSEMTISGSILNTSDEVRNIGVAIAFFDGEGNQVGHEIVQIRNARPNVPYPFTSEIKMALNRPFASSSSYVLYADPVYPDGQ